MKTLLTFLTFLLLSGSAFGQTQGVSMRSTNGFSYGTLTGQKMIATNFTGNGIGLTNIMLTNPVIRGTFTNDSGLGLYLTDGSGLLKGHVTPYTGPNIPGLQFHAADVNVLQLLTNRVDISQDTVFAGTITGNGAGLTNLSVYSMSNSVTAFGAVGDGATDDSTAIQTAIASLGTNAVVLFPPSKTFLVSEMLTPVAGQTWVGYGSTIKRKDSTRTTTATAITAAPGAKTITLADATDFNIGGRVAIFTNTSAGGFDPAVHAISAKSGNDITLSVDFTIAFPTGAVVVSCAGPMVYADADHITMLGLSLDDNRSGNTNIIKWQLHQTLYLNSTVNNFIMEGCTLRESVCDAVYGGGNNVQFTGNTVTNANGNGFHLSAAKDFRAIGNHVGPCNLAGTDPGHQGGCFECSTSVYNTTLANNFCHDALGGITGWAATSIGLLAEGNTISNVSVGAVSFSSGARVMVIRDNLIQDSAPVSLAGTNFVFDGNVLFNTRIYGNARGASIKGNFLSGLSSGYGIDLTNYYGTLANNTVRDGGSGSIYLYNSGCDIFGNATSGTVDSPGLTYGNFNVIGTNTVTGVSVVSGRLAIGTNNPSYAIDVESTAGIRVGGVNNGIGIRLQHGSGRTWILGVGKGGVDSTGFLLHDQTANLTRMYVLASGNVGFGGNTAPASVVDVTGDIRASTTITATNSISGASGSIMLTTNVSIAMGAGVYTNVGNYDYTTVFGNVTASTDALTNGTAGRYYIAIHAAFTGAGGASLYEGAVFTNTVECTIIEWQRDVSATYGSASASGILTLPAGCRVEYKIKSPDAETGTFAKLGLTIMGAN